MKFAAVVSTALIASASAFAPSASTEVCCHRAPVILGLSPFPRADVSLFLVGIWALGHGLVGFRATDAYRQIAHLI